MTKTTTAPKPAAKTAPAPSVASRFQREGEGDSVKFFRIRANGTKRRVPTLSGEALATAQAIRNEREAGGTMKAIAEARHLSVPTVRRMLTSLALTEELAAAAKELAAAAKPKRAPRKAAAAKAPAKPATAKAPAKAATAKTA